MTNKTIYVIYAYSPFSIIYVQRINNYYERDSVRRSPLSGTRFSINMGNDRLVFYTDDDEYNEYIVKNTNRNN